MCGEYYEEDPPLLLKRYIAQRDLKIEALEAAVRNRDATIVQLIRTAEEHRRDMLEAVDHAASLQLDLGSEEEEEGEDQSEINRLEEENQNLSIALQDAEDTISDLRDEIEAFEKAAAKPKKKGGRK